MRNMFNNSRSSSQGDAGVYECHANNKWSMDMRSFRYDRRPFPPSLAPSFSPFYIDFNAAPSPLRVPSSSSALSVKSFQNGLRHRVRKEEEVGEMGRREIRPRSSDDYIFCFVTELCGGGAPHHVSHRRKESLRTIKSCYSE